MKKRIISFLLSISMLVAAVPVTTIGVSAAGTSTIRATDYFKRNADNELVLAPNVTAFAEDNLTILDASAILVTVLRPTTKVAAKNAIGLTDKTRGIFERAVGMGLFSSAAKTNVNAKLSVNGVITILDRAFKFTEAEAMVAAAIDEEVKKGGTSVAQFIAIVDNFAGTILNGNGTYKTASFDTDNVTITKSGITLEGATINGKLTIADGVGNGDVTIKDVTVNGNIVARGCGKNTFKMLGSSSTKELIAANMNHAFRVFAESAQAIMDMIIASGHNGVTVDAACENINSYTTAPVLVTKDAKNVTAAVKDADITIGAKASVGVLSSAASATGATLTVQGAVDALNAAAPGTGVKALNGAKLGLVTTETTATGTTVSAAKGSIIKDLKANAANTAVTGSGDVVSATITGNGVSIGTGSTKVIVAAGAKDTTVGNNPVNGGTNIVSPVAPTAPDDLPTGEITTQGEGTPAPVTTPAVTTAATTPNPVAPPVPVVKTATPAITSTLRAGDTTITGTCVAGAVVTVTIDGTALAADKVTYDTATTVWTAAVPALVLGKVVSVTATKAPNTVSDAVKATVLDSEANILAAAKTAAKAKVDDMKTGLEEAQYTAATWTALTTAITEDKAAIDLLTTKAACEEFTAPKTTTAKAALLKIVTIKAIAGITAPVTGATPVTVITDTDQFTGTVTWNGNPVKFLADTAYTATVTLTAKAGYSFDKVAANYFTVAGGTATSPIGANETIVVTVVYTATAKLVVSNRSISIIAPVAGATSTTTITPDTQFTGAITWTPAAADKFAVDTEYKATVVLTAVADYTFKGLTVETLFTAAGSKTIKTTEVAAEGATATIEITFDKTAVAEDTLAVAKSNKTLALKTITDAVVRGNYTAASLAAFDAAVDADKAYIAAATDATTLGSYTLTAIAAKDKMVTITVSTAAKAALKAATEAQVAYTTAGGTINDAKYTAVTSAIGTNTSDVEIDKAVDTTVLAAWTSALGTPTTELTAETAKLNTLKAAKTAAITALNAAKAELPLYVTAGGKDADKVYTDLTAAIGSTYETEAKINAVVIAGTAALTTWTGNLTAPTDALKLATATLVADKAATTAAIALVTTPIASITVAGGDNATAEVKAAAIKTHIDAIEGMANDVTISVEKGTGVDDAKWIVKATKGNSTSAKTIEVTAFVAPALTVAPASPTDYTWAADTRTLTAVKAIQYSIDAGKNWTPLAINATKVFDIAETVQTVEVRFSATSNKAEAATIAAGVAKLVTTVGTASTTFYATLSAAVAKANQINSTAAADTVITLLADVTEDNGITVSKPMTINGTAGKTLAVTKGVKTFGNWDESAILVKSANVKISNLKLTIGYTLADGEAIIGITVTGATTLAALDSIVLEGNTITVKNNNGTNKSYGIYSTSNKITLTNNTVDSVLGIGIANIDTGAAITLTGNTVTSGAFEYYIMGDDGYIGSNTAADFASANGGYAKLNTNTKAIVDKILGNTSKDISIKLNSYADLSKQDPDANDRMENYTVTGGQVKASKYRTGLSNGVWTDVGTALVSTEAELTAALKSKDVTTIKLTADITNATGITVDRVVTIDGAKATVGEKWKLAVTIGVGVPFTDPPIDKTAILVTSCDVIIKNIDLTYTEAVSTGKANGITVTAVLDQTTSLTGVKLAGNTITVTNTGTGARAYGIYAASHATEITGNNVTSESGIGVANFVIDTAATITGNTVDSTVNAFYIMGKSDYIGSDAGKEFCTATGGYNNLNVATKTIVNQLLTNTITKGFIIVNSYSSIISPLTDDKMERYTVVNNAVTVNEFSTDGATWTKIQ